MATTRRWLSRREFAGLSAGALAALGVTSPFAHAQEDTVADGWQAHIDAILNGEEAVEDKVTIDLPETVENGNLVPFTVAVDPPESETDFIQAVHVIATANPSAPVISFYFTPLTGAARAASRMRLLQTQDVVALAQTGNGHFFIGRRRVEIVVGCCGG